MLMVLLAVVLFSTLIITIYNNMFFQIDLAESKLFYTQAIKISDYIFQQFEIEMVSDQTSFEELYEKYKTKQFYDATNTLDIDYLDTDYKYSIISEYCDQSGNTEDISGTSDHQKLTVEISTTVKSDSLFLGSYIKVFSDMTLSGL